MTGGCQPPADKERETLKDIDIHCVGNALVDVFAEDSGGIASRYGLTLPVQHVEIEKLAAILAELGAVAPPAENPSSPVFVSGGGAANVAKIAGYLGARVSFTGAIGSGGNHTGGINAGCEAKTDEAAAGESGGIKADGMNTDGFGRFFAQSLAAAGVKLSLCVKPLPTGICLTLKTGGETRIAASPSAALELSESDVGAEEIRRAKVVVIDGFMLHRSGLVRRILRLAEAHGTTAAIDASSVFIAAERAREIADYAARYPLVLFMNEAEATAFYGSLGIEKEKIERGEYPALTGPRPGFPIIVVKLGERGAVCVAGGSVRRAETVPVIPAETTGAGDAFSAAFLSALTRKKSLADCAALGNKAARLVLDAEGSQPDERRLKDFNWSG